MIISKLQGGLGNQMFQYAAGFALAKKLKTSLKLDLSYYRQDFIKTGDTKRVYELDCFRLRSSIISKLEGKIYPFLSQHKILFTYYQEQGLKYDQNLLKQTGNLYLKGFWPSEKYFSWFRNDIKKEFKFKVIIKSGFAEKINKSNSVSIHVRRSDYLTNKNANKYHGICSLDYYNSAIKLISSKIKDTHFFIFSDDLDWCRQNIKAPQCTFIETIKGKDWMDMQLMSLCKHNVIANSTFSWWGAWLNESPEKIVIAPEKWFNDSSIDSSDLIPTQWTKL